MGKESIMQLLIITLDDCNEFLRAISDLKDHGMNGIVFPSTSLKHALLQSKIDDAPIFGGISKLVNNDLEASHTILILVHDEQIEKARQIVRKITKGLEKKGVMFALPVSFFEGID